MAAELTWRNETGAELRTWHVARHHPFPAREARAAGTRADAVL